MISAAASLSLVIGRARGAEAAQTHGVIGGPWTQRTHRLDELDLPRYRERVCNRGFETRTKHFVVFATTSQEHATWTAHQMERAWNDIGRLADQWTGVHRQETFGIGAVGVVLVDEARSLRRQPANGPLEAIDPANIQVNLSDGAATLHERLPELRRRAFYAFLDAAGQHDALPDWTRDGLAAYVSGETPRHDGLARLDPPWTASSQERTARVARPARNAVPPSAKERAQAALWVRFLLEADDAKYAPRFFDAMSAAVAAQSQEPYALRRKARKTGRFVSHVRPKEHSAFEALIATAAAEGRLTQWLADPKAGQPVVKPFPEEMPLDERHREMVLILKLFERFPPPGIDPLRPKTYEFRSGRPASVPAGLQAQQPMTPRTRNRTTSSFRKGTVPFSLRENRDRPQVILLPPPTALYHRLLTLPRWATIDVDGSLLVSNDRSRLAQRLGVSSKDVQYRTFRREEVMVLEATFLKTGEVFEAWLEDHPDNPGRPMARIRKRP